MVAVNRVNLSVEKGQIVGIIGPNGAGKTTLFSIISGFLKPDAGNVAFNGERLSGLAPHRVVRKGLTRSFQIVQVFAEMTVHVSVVTAALLRRPMTSALRRADEVLERVGLSQKRLESPFSLSLQDKKMLEVAKCIATDPQLILLDEVMAGLTLAEARAPIEIIKELRADGMTFLMVEHVIPVVMNLADRMVVLNFGEKIADSIPTEVVRDQQVRDAYFGDEAIDA
ncbi:MAG: ABC transporter ATP-binding protein [Beijerinckiaceae bacterium]